ncbi:hypothetical protein [Rhizobium sp. Leaf341]|uniref:hypothetical protein n=1 Tax=Rhizobium sp. Leaf341 TaxID=1736344 RepID=UPI0012E3A0F3|nr:hypothetical protein [Rhizobium sp. Leaf341]
MTFDPVAPQARAFEPPIIGVNVYYGPSRVLGYNNSDTGLRQLHEVGAVSTRDYLPWQAFKFPPGGSVVRAGGERMMRFLPKSDLLPLINLGHTNSLTVPGGIPPITDEGLRYFGAYLRKAVELTGPYNPIYEIWNEWNMTIGYGEREKTLDGEGPSEDPRAAVHYVRVAKFAVETIWQKMPNARILVGAVGDDEGWKWAQAVVRDGALDNTLGLSVHLYNQCRADKAHRTAAEMIERVEDLQAKLKDIRGGVETPIYVTEYGWPTLKGNCGMPYDDTAYNFAQFILQSATIPWIKGIWIHALKNISPDPLDRESNYGLFTYDDKPKMAVCFVRAATDLVKSADAIEVRQPFKDVFVARVTSGQSQKIIFWTSYKERSATVALPFGTQPGQTMCGERHAALQKVALGPAPLVYDVDSSRPFAIDVTDGTSAVPSQN